MKSAPRQFAVLLFVHHFSARHGFAPTIREIGDAFDIASTNGVNDHLKSLERKGLITRRSGMARTLVVTPRGIQQCLLSAAEVAA